MFLKSSTVVKASLHSVAGVSLTLGRTGSFVASLLPLSCLSWERERGVVTRPQTSSFVRIHLAHQNYCIVHRNYNTERQEAFDKIVNINVFFPFLSETTTKGDQSQC